MRDYFEERERTLAKRIAEFEAALLQIIAQGGKAKAIARKALGLTDISAERASVCSPASLA
jgi:hypothetical protein